MTTRRSAVEDEDYSIEAILDRAGVAAKGKTTSVGETLDALGHLSLSAFILIPALLVVTPLSVIPGLPTLAGIIIGLTSMQMLIGRNDLWLPSWILQRSIETEKLEKILNRLRTPARYVDRRTHPRFKILAGAPARTALQIACMICGFTMPIFELVPFSSSVLAGTVTFFAIALVTRDGLIAAIGLLFVAAAIILILTALI